METNKSSGTAEPGLGQSGTSGTVSGPGATSAGASATQAAFDDSAATGEGSRPSLREELSNLKRDLDTLVSRAASLTDRELTDARDRLMTKFGSVRESAKGMYSNVSSKAGEQFGSMRESAKGVYSKAGDQLNQGMDTTTQYVKENPVQSIAIAAGVGLLLGALLRGSSDRSDRDRYDDRYYDR